MTPETRKRSPWLAALMLAGTYSLAAGAGFFAPYDATAQDRSLPSAPPVQLRWVDAEDRWHLRPFIYPWKEVEGRFGEYEEDRLSPRPLRFFVETGELGSTAERRFFGIDPPSRIPLLGTDELGRDQLSRLLTGARISLAASLLATAIALGLGWPAGVLAGYFGGRAEDWLMRGSELFMTLPWLYLLLAFRAFLPLQISPEMAFGTTVLVIGSMGWARPARLVRAVAAEARQRSSVLAARGFGASHFYLLRRHIVPLTRGVVLTQAALLLPRYILAEVTLSFLGLGMSEPWPSWGTLLAEAQYLAVLDTRTWMLWPAVALALVVMSYHRLAGHLQQRFGAMS